MKTADVIFAASFLVLLSKASHANAQTPDDERRVNSTSSFTNNPEESDASNSTTVQASLKNDELFMTNTSAKKEIDQRDTNGFNAIYYAVKENAPRTAAFLVNLCADLNQIYENDSLTLLQVAEKHGSLLSKDWFTNRTMCANASINGTGVDARNKDGFNAICYAVLEDAVDTASALVDLGADLRQVYGINGGVNLIHLAALSGKLRATKWLLSKGLSVNSTTEELSHTPLHFAAYRGYLPMIKLLLENDACIDCKSVRGDTPLHLAAEQGHLPAVKLFIESGACIDCKSEALTTPLDDAARYGKLSVVKLFIESGACIDCKSEALTTPLDDAARYGKLSVVKELLKVSSCINCTSYYSYTPLHYAARYGHLPVVKLLVESGACIDCKTDIGATPLHHAAEDGHLTVVKELLKVSSCINCTDIYGSMPLHLAALHGHLPVVKLLVESGACLNCRKSPDHTPLYLAEDCGHPEVAEYLKSVGGVK